METVGDEIIDWEAFFQSVPESVDLFADGLDIDFPPQISPEESPKGSSNASPISVSSWIDNLEQFLLDDDSREAAKSQGFCDNFFSDIVPDSRSDEDAPVVGEIPCPDANSATEEDEEKEKSGVSDEDGGVLKGEIQNTEANSAAEKENKENGGISEESERIREDEEEEEEEEEDEQLRKKRKRYE